MFVRQIIVTIIEKIHQESERLETQLSLGFHVISLLALVGLKRKSMKKRLPTVLDRILAFNAYTDRRLTVTLIREITSGFRILQTNRSSQ